MTMKITHDLYNYKSDILQYFRHKANKSYGQIIKIYGERDYKKRANAINQSVIRTAEKIKSIIIQKSTAQNWTKKEILSNILMISYCSYVVMIEFRNRAWPYEYMAFSRRIGELWEPFCINCFKFPVRDDVELFEPPLFSDVRKKLQREIIDYIQVLNLTDGEKSQLIQYYGKVWSLVISGKIKLELDLHFKIGIRKYNVDFKSGLPSNEKGNTNRLLLVASIYKNIIEENNECFLFVRTQEDQNNHYLQTLKNSGIWDVFCGDETYEQIKIYSGFDLKKWINEHIHWRGDLDQETINYFKKNDLDGYLVW